jgi:hypothetical protein
MTLAVIGAGYPRTGTASLKLALEELGLGPCYHMRELIMDPSRAALWVAAAEGRPDWEAIFKGYRSTTDAPGCTFWAELMEVYPSAKILLSVRDPEEWFESTQATVFGPIMSQMAIGTPLQEFFRTCVFPEFGDRIHDRAFMIEQFQRHTEEVVSKAPKDRLLVFDVREGWGPLCAFLGVDVPSTPFPRTNAREEMIALRQALAGPDGGPVDFEKVSAAARERFGAGRG